MTDIELDKTGIPTNTGGTENGYSVEITDYVYEKISKINRDEEFTNEDIEEYDLNLISNKIDISTTSKFIKYLKSFIKVHFKNVKSEHDDFVEDMESEVDRLDGRIDELTSNILDSLYPVGSVYMTFDSTNPNNLFGGNWVKIENKFLLGSGSRMINATGGEENHTLTINEMPTHTHTQNQHKHTPTDTTVYDNYKFLAVTDGADIKISTQGRKTTESGGDYFFLYTEDAGTIWERSYTGTVTAINNNTGGNTSHNNMPPYIVVHIWRRVQ